MEFYSRDNLHNKMKYGACVINLDEYSDIGTHRIALYSLSNNVTYFDSFSVEHIPQEIEIFIGNSVISGYFCIGFIEFMLKDKLLTDFANLF